MTSLTMVFVVQCTTLRDYSVGEQQVQAQTELPSALLIPSHVLVSGLVITPVALDFVTRAIVAKQQTV